MKNLKYFIILLFISYPNLNYSMEEDSFLIVRNGESDPITEEQDQTRMHHQLENLVKDIGYKKSGWDKRNNISYNDLLKELDDLLKSQYIKIDFEILWSAIHAELDDVLKLLIKYAKQQEFDFNQKNEKMYGPTLLYLAVSFRNKEAVRMLLEEKSDPRLKTNNGKNSLNIAEENLEWSKKLKQQGSSDPFNGYDNCLEIYQLLIEKDQE